MIQPINRIGHYDVVIVEGTFAGVTAAIRLAADGLRVALVMSGTSPLHEFTTCMGSVLSAAERAALPPELAGCFPEGVATACGDDRLYPHAAVAEAAENALLDAGVDIFYDAHPGGVLMGGRDSHSAAPRVAGVVFGGSFGMVAATASSVVDCTGSGLPARAAGGVARPRNRHEHALCSSFLHTESECSHGWIELPDGVRIRFMGHLAEVRFRHAGDVPIGGPRGSAQRHRTLRDSLIAHALAWPVEHQGLPFAIRRVADDMLVVAPSPITLDRCRGVHLLSIAGDDRPDAAGYLDMRLRYVADVPRVVTAVREDLDTGGFVSSPSLPYDLRLPDHPSGMTRDDASFADTTIRLGLSDPRHDEPHCDRIDIRIGSVPLRQRADVIVCGLGTAGIEAARVSAAHGLVTVGFEKHADVGGINTIGGVPVYWYGRRTPYFKRWHRTLKDRMRESRLPVALSLYERARQDGAVLNLKTPYCGVVVEDHRVTGVVCMDDDGLFLASGRHVIDAGGSGDIAAWAGADYTYGSGRDEITYWYSFGQFVHGKREASRQYLSVVDTRGIRDLTRGVIAGRRMTGILGRGEFVQDYLALRESRHITGRTVVTYHDVMAGRAFPDAVLWCRSNADIKGMASSTAVMCGFVEQSYLRNFEMSIPYGALTPVTLANVLVIGKAYSITHDGLGLARMQPDMIQLGVVAGMVLAVAHERDTGNLHDLDVARLQEQLMRVGVLVPGDLPVGPEDDRLPPETDDALDDLVDRVVECPPEPCEWARLFMTPERAAIRLLAVAGSGGGMRPATARLICALGDRGGADRLLEELDVQLADGLPGLADRHPHDMPDHGWAPYAVHLINALAECGERRVIARLETVLGRLDLDRSVSDYRFCYVHAFAYAGDRLTDPALIPLLDRLLDHPVIRNGTLGRDMDPRLSRHHIAERYAYLELCLARALARCGSLRGYETLITFTGDMRAYLARSARSELCDLSGVDHGYDRAAWRTWLAAASVGGLVPQPYTRRLA